MSTATTDTADTIRVPVPARVWRALRLASVLERRRPEEILARELTGYIRRIEARADQVIANARDQG